MFEQCLNIEGDVAECGVGFGQTTFILDPHVLPTGKKLYAFDTFSGLPYDDQIITPDQCKRGEMNCGELFFSRFKALKKTSIKPVIGLIENTLKTYSSTKFCFAWIDLDLYQATSFAYKFFEDRMSRGGIIGFHDYGFIRCPGVKVVVDKEINYSKYEIIFLRNNCTFLRRK
jgi:O-methyltransferase